MATNTGETVAPQRGAAPARKAVCVYCGSRDAASARFEGVGAAIGAGVAARGWRLVYGAGDRGLMGITARAARAAGGEVLGVIPRGLFERETPDRRHHGVVVTETLHQRKALMLENSDAVLILPGGVGTLDELVEAITWRQLGLHAKPIVLVNAGAYWAPLLALFDHMRDAGFLYEDLSGAFELADGAEMALDILARKLV